MTKVVYLGQRPFHEVHQEMLDHLARVHRSESEGEVWMVEHEPVFTAGRATPKEQMRDGIIPIERGGQITFHGPGQLVIYPIIRLPKRDVRAWLRQLEAFGVGICEQFGLSAVPSVDGTGVFVDGRKVASIGVAIRHWINLHGISINVAMDLAGFQQIQPCGLDPSIMSDLCRATGRTVSLEEVRQAAQDQVPSLLT